MPIVHIYVTPPIDDASQKEELFRSVTEAISKSLGKSPEQTRILLHELAESGWSVGGETVEARLRTQRSKPAR
ncbi:tautomerase family protein [Hyalangium versicolor]|uniref:tautomerase family protein n=1 Tax=Hyalangium versicolor TaxID=2861190 RepID=UPI001CCA7D62|nr:4-oxalocrotonate tautomerase family protein [Hyalangium versicolor]